MSLVVIYELPLLPSHWIYEGFLTRYWFWVCEKRKSDMELFKIHTERKMFLNWEHSFLKIVQVHFGINIRTKWWEEKS